MSVKLLIEHHLEFRLHARIQKVLTGGSTFDSFLVVGAERIQIPL